jgi:ABC-type dipeptide/oligopeptide/nickel transport system ATPase component
LPLLEIKNLQLEFGREPSAVRALDGVSLTIEAGQTLCLLGESGSSKTVTALSITRLLPSPPANYVGGQILIEGRDVLTMSTAELRRIRGGVVSYIFQEPGAALNPVLRIGTQIREALKVHRPAAATEAEVLRLSSASVHAGTY